MVKIKKGRFLMGSRKKDADRGFEGTAREVETDSYCIDRYEYPNRKGAKPLTGVSLDTARRLCAAAGKRLCDDKEWVKACAGPRGYKYPYGNKFDPDGCVTEDRNEEARAVAPSGSFKRCRSGYGVYDMSGNVAEWTTSGRVRGGSAKHPDYATRCVHSSKKSPGSKDPFVGFRCCMDAR